VIAQREDRYVIDSVAKSQDLRPSDHDSFKPFSIIRLPSESLTEITKCKLPSIFSGARGSGGERQNIGIEGMVFSLCS
jgi:hypothetical protein